MDSPHHAPVRFDGGGLRRACRGLPVLAHWGRGGVRRLRVGRLLAVVARPAGQGQQDQDEEEESAPGTRCNGDGAGGYGPVVSADVGAISAGVGGDVGGRSSGNRSAPRGGSAASSGTWGWWIRLCGARPGATVVAFDIGAVATVMGADVGHGRSSMVRGQEPMRGRGFIGAAFNGSDSH